MKLKQISLIFLSLLFLLQGLALAQSLEQKRFKITRNTLNHLQREGLSSDLLHRITALKDTIFPAKSVFLKTLKALIPPPQEAEQKLILQYAEMSRLKIQADEFSGSMKDGAMEFRNHVVGRIPRENIDFLTQKLRLFSGENKLYEKMIGKGAVEIKQWDRSLKTDYALYQNIKLPDNSSIPANSEAAKQSLQLEGNIHFSSLQGSLKSHLLRADLLQHTLSIEGKGTKKRIWIEVYPDRLSNDFYLSQRSKTLALAPSSAPTEETKITVQAFRASLDESKKQAIFEGNVEMTRDDLYVRAGRIIFDFDAQQKLILIRAEQSLCLQQPGRTARANSGIVDDVKQQIILNGNAVVNSEQYNLKGDNIHLYLDVNKGAARGNNKTPIEVTIAMGGNTASSAFSCKEDRNK